MARQFLLLAALLFLLPGAALAEGSDKDPWESMNRRIFAFNEGLDKYALKPAARGYRAVTPDPMERGVTNFIANIYEFNTIINSTLQGRAADAFDSTGRFIINSTVGVLGLFDVATRMGIERKPADFGQTLAVWGVDQGPYLMLPVLGPRTVRSGAGNLFDTYTSIPNLYGDEQSTLAFFAIETIDIRAQLIKADELVTGDRYIFVREVDLQRREAFVNGGVIEDSFSDFESGEDFEDF